MRPNSNNFDNEILWFVWVYKEVDILTNILQSIAKFRSNFGEYWPKQIVVGKHNRITVGFGEDIVVERADWTLQNALYYSLYEPYYESHRNAQQPRKFFGKRTTVEDKSGKYFRLRRSKDDGEISSV